MWQGKIRSNVVVAERLYIYNSLRRCPAFAALLPETLYDLADKVSIKLHPDISLSADRLKQTTNVEAFAPGTVILRHGEPIDETSRFYLIREGRVEIRQDLGEGEKVQVVLGKHKEFGDCFAWLASLASLSGIDLAQAARKYDGGCPRCRKTPCACP